jgi:signal transduction histidine kinase
MFAAQEEERRRVAYEVHDGVSQVAAGAQQHLESYAYRYRPRSEAARAALDHALELARRTVREARRVIGDLRPTELDDFGLARAVRMQIDALRIEGWDASYCSCLEDERLPPPVEAALFRIAQEALVNVRKHAGPTRVRVCLEREDHLVRLEVQDWGRGFDEASVAPPGHAGEHIGLRAMRERVAYFGGRFSVETSPGTGTRILAEVPVRVGAR